MRRFTFDSPPVADIPGWYDAEPGTTDKYTVRGLIAHGDICEVYDGTGVGNEPVIVKVARSASNNDLLENEYEVLTEARKSASWIKEGEIKMPLPLETFRIDVSAGRAKRRVNVFSLTPRNDKPPLKDPVTLKEVHIAYPRLDPKDAAWMFNRLIDAIHCLHAVGYVHGAITPDHLIVEPESHRGQLLDYSYAVKPGEIIKSISTSWTGMYAREILDKEPVTWSTDIYMAARCMFYLLGMEDTSAPNDSLMPRPMYQFLKACILGPKHRIQNTWQAHEDFHDLLKQLWGERKFHVFEMPKS